MPEDIKVQIDNIVREIKDSTNTDRIYLFGSYAYGNPNEDSDLDICVLTSDKNVRKIDMMRKIRKAISNVATMPVDLIVYYNEEFQERAKLDCTMEHKIALEGISIYEQ